MRAYRVACVVIGLLCLTICGCASSGQRKQPTEESDLTVGMVKSQVIKGETTQAEILEMFGAPNLITKNKDSDEVWDYNRMSFESATDTEGGTLILWSRSRATSTTTTKSFDLILTFDENDVVKDYSIISASF